MSINKKSPGRLLDKVRAIGLPYHGLVENDTLKREGHPDKAWLQPPQGGLYTVRRPNWTAPERTAEEQAWDALRGFEWRDYALIGGRVLRDGNALHLGGKNIRGWIWFDEHNQPWRVSQTLLFGPQLEFKFERFGAFAGAPEEFVLSTPMLDLQQSVPQTYLYRPQPFVGLSALSESAGHYELLDITPDGRRTLWMYRVNHYSTPSAWADTPSSNTRRPYLTRPIAIVEVAVSGDRVITATVLKGRNDCIGELSYTGDDRYSASFSQVRVSEITSGGGQPCGPGSFWQREWQLESSERTGTITPTGDPGISVFWGVGFPDWMGVGSLDTQELENDYTCIIGAWYQGESVRYARMRLNMKREASGSHSLNVTSNSYVVECNNGTLTSSGSLEFDFSSESTITVTVTCALMVDDDVLDSEVFTSTTTTSIEGSAYPSGTSATLLNYDMTGTRTDLVTGNGGEVLGETTYDASMPTKSWHRGGGIYDQPVGLSWGGGWSAPQIFIPTRPEDVMSALPVQIYNGDQLLFVGPVQWDQTTFGLVRQYLVASGQARHEFGTAFARGHPVVEAATTYIPAPQANVAISAVGSWQPHTEQWAGNVGPMPDPLSWV